MIESFDFEIISGEDCKLTLNYIYDDEPVDITGLQVRIEFDNHLGEYQAYNTDSKNGEFTIIIPKEATQKILRNASKRKFDFLIFLKDGEDRIIASGDMWLTKEPLNLTTNHRIKQRSNTTRVDVVATGARGFGLNVYSENVNTDEREIIIKHNLNNDFVRAILKSDELGLVEVGYTLLDENQIKINSKIPLKGTILIR